MDIPIGPPALMVRHIDLAMSVGLSFMDLSWSCFEKWRNWILWEEMSESIKVFQ